MSKSADLNIEIEKALSEWVTSLPTAEANSTAMCVSGIEYTPAKILEEIQHQTDFGKEFLTGLSILHSRIIESEPDASIVDLIRRSIGEMSSDKEPAVMEHEIGTTAGEIYRALDGKGEVSLAKLREQVGVNAPVFDWAVGWLAREHKISITLKEQSFHICLKEIIPEGEAARPREKAAAASGT